MKRLAVGEKVKKAAVWTRQELIELRDRSPTRLRALIDLMMVVPIRASCLRYLRYENIKIRDQYLDIVIPGGKTISSQQAVAPRTFMMSEFLPRTVRLLTAGLTSQRIFDVSVEELNSLLRRHAGRAISSYSIRNCAINSRIDQTRDERGVPDYERASRVTGHRHTTALSGRYEYA